MCYFVYVMIVPGGACVCRRRPDDAEGLRDAHEGGAEGHLLHHRRVAQGRRELALHRAPEEEGLRGARLPRAMHAQRAQDAVPTHESIDIGVDTGILAPEN